jgi:hypothetical protein
MTIYFSHQQLILWGFVGIFLAGSYRFWTVVILNSLLGALIRRGTRRTRIRNSQLSTYVERPFRIIRLD